MIWINYRIWINFVYLFTTHDISSSQSHHNTSSLYCSADSQRQYKPFVLQSPEKSESCRQYKPFVLQQLTQEHNTNRLYCRRLGGSSYHICCISIQETINRYNYLKEQDGVIWPRNMDLTFRILTWSALRFQ